MSSTTTSIGTRASWSNGPAGWTASARSRRENIEVYEPFLAGTHDEKMFLVVKDRAGWFDVVMGRATRTDEHATDVEEARVPLHPRISAALSMDLTSR